MTTNRRVGLRWVFVMAWVLLVGSVQAAGLQVIDDRGVTVRWDAPPQRIVYVSCNPATLARDAGLLVHEAGYRCVAAGVVNMFAHTAHVESMAVFELGTDPAN